MQTNDIEAFRPHSRTTTPEFSLAGHQTYARLLSVYDGDTMTCVLPFLGKYFQFSIRLAGIDTCEMRSKHPINKELAIKARDRIVSLATQNQGPTGSMTTKKELEAFLDAHVSLVYVHCHESDKYGRILADVRRHPADPWTFQQMLMDEKLAYAYQGDTKLTEEEQRNLLQSLPQAPLF